MKHIWTRYADFAKDTPEFIEYMKGAQDINLFDPDVMTYPNTKVLAAYGQEGVKMFMPFQMTITLESLAPKPGLTEREEALALKELAQQVVFLAKANGIEEVYFLCSDDTVINFAEKHGFERIPHTTMRLKLKTLEQPEKGDAVESEG